MDASDPPRRRKISAIIACYKDAQAIPIMAERLTQTFRKIEVDYEIIFVNDGSPDDTQPVLEQLAAADPHIKGITHSRNFGSQNAFTSGMQLASGDACVLLDGDLQDPPELIADFYTKWCEGFDVVYGVRVKREMPTFTEFGYKAFYRLFQSVAYVRVPLDAGDFSLIDRSVMNVINALPERDRFLRGLRAWAGFKQTGVPYMRPERMFGRSTNNLWSNIRWARKGIFSFSYVPLELISVGALVVSFLSLLAGIAQIVAKIFWPHVPQGIPTIIVLSLFLGSIQLFSIAFLAEYVGKIFEEVKQRPHFVVTKLLNFDAQKAEAARGEAGRAGAPLVGSVAPPVEAVALRAEVPRVDTGAPRASAPLADTGAPRVDAPRVDTGPPRPDREPRSALVADGREVAGRDR